MLVYTWTMSDYKSIFKGYNGIIALILITLIFLVLLYLNRSTINNYQGVFNVALTGILAIATLGYAILTINLVDESAKTREIQGNILKEAITSRDLQYRPKLAIYLRSNVDSISIVETVITNTGALPAKDISLKPSENIINLSEKKIVDLGPFKEGIKYLGPNEKLLLFAVNMLEDPDNKLKMKIKMEIEYSNYFGQQPPYIDDFILNYAELEGTLQIGHTGLHEIANNLETIGDKMEYFRNKENVNKSK